MSGFYGYRIPDIEGMSVVAATVADHRDKLLEAERPVVAGAVEKRVREFASGRYVARLAMQALSLPTAAIPRDTGRQPIWPQGCVGSITHGGELAIAAVADAGALRGVGIDLEVLERVNPAVAARVLTARELARREAGDPRLPGVVFSAKEAVYKAVHPLVGRFVAFQEVEVDVEWPEQRFRSRYVGKHPPNRVMEEGRGFFGFFERYVLTLFIIP